MAIFRIINGEKRLFAEINKLETINGISAESDKNIDLDASNIYYDSTDKTYFIKSEIDGKINYEDIRASDTDGVKRLVTAIVPTITDVTNDDVVRVAQFFSDLDGLKKGPTQETFDIEAGEGISFERVEDPRYPGSKILSKFVINNDLTEDVSELLAKTQLSANEKVLTWSAKTEGGDPKLKSHLSLVYANNKVQLLGKNKQVVSEFDLILGSALVLNEIVKSTSNNLDLSEITETDIIKKAEIITAFGSGNADGQYLILGFKDADDDVQYSFANLSEIIEDYTAGDGIEIIQREIGVKIDPDSEKGISVSEDGLLLEFWTGTANEFNSVGSNKANDGVYFVIEDGSEYNILHFAFTKFFAAQDDTSEATGWYGYDTSKATSTEPATVGNECAIWARMTPRINLDDTDYMKDKFAKTFIKCERLDDGKYGEELNATLFSNMGPPNPKNQYSVLNNAGDYDNWGAVGGGQNAAYSNTEDRPVLDSVFLFFTPQEAGQYKITWELWDIKKAGGNRKTEGANKVATTSITFDVEN